MTFLKALLFVVLIFLILPLSAQQNSQSAIVDIESTDQGLLIPRMTTVQRENISTPDNSLLVFDEDHASFWFYDKTKWEELGHQFRGTNCVNVLDHGAIADKATDNSALINALIIDLNQRSMQNGVNVGWEMCIRKNVLFDFDALQNLPDDYLIFDNSTFDWQRYPIPGVNFSTLWTAQTKIIMHTSNPGMKNANEQILMSDYHPALTIDNSYDYSNPSNEDYQASIVFASSGDRKWRMGMGTLGNPDLVIAGRTPSPANALTSRMHIKDDFGNFGFNSFSVVGIDYQFGESDDSNPLNFKFLGKQDEITWLFHHNGNAAASSSRISFDDTGRIRILQNGNYGTTFGEGQTIYGFRKQIGQLTLNTILTKNDNNKVITNTGSTGMIELTLPPASSIGDHVRIVVTENQIIRILTDAADQFRTNVSFLESDIPGSSVELYSVVSGIWEVNVINGNW